MSAAQLRVEYHPASDGDTAKTPDDMVIIDLATRLITPLVRFPKPGVARDDTVTASESEAA